jgi:cyclic pyranopterin phosphate synthase
MSVTDVFGRPLRSLRLSVTDRCNIRCAYCMPEADYHWLPRERLLSFEETARLVDVFVSLGVTRVRLTGGEPLLRRDLAGLVAMLAARPALADLAITTNGILLAGQVRALHDAGLRRVTVSLDTLRPDRFRALTRFDRLDAVLAGIDAAADVFGTLKLDMVVVRDVNDDELADMLEFARRRHAEVRFIEYMDVGGATGWAPQAVVSRREVLDRLADRYGPPEPVRDHAWAPAERFRWPDGTTFGVISSVTQPFCRTCDRARLTADGQWFPCLYADRGLNLRDPLRRGAGEPELRALVATAWQSRDDRGAERRLDLAERAALVPRESLRRNVHLEMHTRGG